MVQRGMSIIYSDMPVLLRRKRIDKLPAMRISMVTVNASEISAGI